MPIPKPNVGESRDKFMSRCLSSDVMQQDYSDNAQRFAVCSSSFDERIKKCLMKKSKKLRQDILK